MRKKFHKIRLKQADRFRVMIDRVMSHWHLLLKILTITAKTPHTINRIADYIHNFSIRHDYFDYLSLNPGIYANTNPLPAAKPNRFRPFDHNYSKISTRWFFN
jgi:hypothetical protein